MSVILRKRKQKSNIRLYLDIYNNKKRSYEFLKIHLIPSPKTNFEKEFNKEQLRIANIIKHQRELEIETSEYNISNHIKNKNNFIDYIDKVIEQKQKYNTKYVFYSMKQNFIKFLNSDILSFKDINIDLLNNFQNYLLKKYNTNTAREYIAKLKHTLSQARKEKLITINYFENISSIKPIESKFVFLSLQELIKISNTEYRSEITNPFLFACYTGLRYSDIFRLKYSDIIKNENQYYYRFTQRKTSTSEMNPIHSDCLKYIDINKIGLNELIFKSNQRQSNFNHFLNLWIKKAGINKKIGFHTARHTFAILLLNNGVDLYTLSKLLNHKDLKTTEKSYAKLFTESKRKALEYFPKITLELE